MLGFAFLVFALNLFLIQYDSLIREHFSQYLPELFALVDPVIRYLQINLIIEYGNLVPGVVLWLFIGFVLAVMREQGLKGLKKIPNSFLLSGKDISETGIHGFIFLIVFTSVTFLIGLYFNNTLLILFFIVSILYALSARQNGILVMAIRLLYHDMHKMIGDPNRSGDVRMIPIGYSLASLMGIWFGFIASLLYLIVAL
ncbi:MAG: hypothetical protein D5R96_08310 [Methanocalculus sp. MSAO_Arc2]|nr:MAG: hypothetical protein D5R96_08310 [Methanocalculus sp. MSAO_Arc2]